ncbi:GntR family transcriptional regulator [Microbacterium sp. SORGH_AS_0888]|uniref:GntR family transcriptional regulator n=1 Tax=Microbacterium sp. SORGH_AS_0888 TaxID=3041791 RepID=UPI002782A95F|nr:GntR family transcriptional regulator [Microbacterium sp. SORGH_AS_0888]MDQ1130715.1 GntR family transcriptional regulator [Microbacterium sp. SORGH_AS_0888]
MTDVPALYARLLSHLDALDFEAGERIGTERSLAEQFGVTRSVLRAALGVLESEGRVRRTIGRMGGVFSWDGKIERHLNAIEGVPDMLRQQGFRSATEVLSAEIAIATPIECRALQLDPGAAVFRLRRRRDANDVPLSLDSMTLPMRLVPGFPTVGHAQSVYRILAEKYGIEAAEANETIDVSSATEEQARILQVEAGAPLLEIHRVTYSQHGVPFEFAHDFFRSDRTRITLRRHGARWKRVDR